MAVTNIWWSVPKPLHPSTLLWLPTPPFHSFQPFQNTFFKDYIFLSLPEAIYENIMSRLATPEKIPTELRLRSLKLAWNKDSSYPFKKCMLLILLWMIHIFELALSYSQLQALHCKGIALMFVLFTQDAKVKQLSVMTIIINFDDFIFLIPNQRSLLCWAYSISSPTTLGAGHLLQPWLPLGGDQYSSWHLACLSHQPIWWSAMRTHTYVSPCGQSHEPLSEECRTGGNRARAEQQTGRSM